MAEVYDFETDFNFTSWAMQFDQFHDWVMLEIRVFADEGFQLTAQQYRAELVLVDPYERFDIKTIYFGFENVEISSFKGLSSLSSELSGLVFERTPTGVRLASPSGNYLRIDAEKMAVCLDGGALT